MQARTSAGIRSILVPLVGAFRALVEDGHGLVSTSNLDRLEVCSIVLAGLSRGAANLSLVYVLPSVGATKHIIYLFAVELHLVLELVLHSEYVRAGLAEEAEVAHGALSQQNVGAGWAK